MQRKFAIAKRLRSISCESTTEENNNKTFVYHNTNKCYKNYTHVNKLKSIEIKSKQTDEKPMLYEPISLNCQSGIEKHTTRSSFTPRPPPSTQKDPKTLSCVICVQITNKKIYEKYRISENKSAVRLIEAANHNQDAVYTPIADLLRETMEDSVKAVITVDLYCHPHCRLAYTVIHKRGTEILPREKTIQY